MPQLIIICPSLLNVSPFSYSDLLLMRVYFVRNNDTDTGNFSKTKTFLTADDVIPIFHAAFNDPARSMAADGFRIAEIHKTNPIAQPRWVETSEGQVALGVVCFVCLAGITVMTAVALDAGYFARREW